MSKRDIAEVTAEYSGVAVIDAVDAVAISGIGTDAPRA
jgi:hypothetical protein